MVVLWKILDVRVVRQVYAQDIGSRWHLSPNTLTSTVLLSLPATLVARQVYEPRSSRDNDTSVREDRKFISEISFSLITGLNTLDGTSGLHTMSGFGKALTLHTRVMVLPDTALVVGLIE